MGGRTLALLVACTLFAVLSLGAPATAPGVNSAPVIRATSPAHGAIVSGPFSVSAQIDSWAGLATATVSVSGVNYPFTWTGGPEEAEFNFSTRIFLLCCQARTQSEFGLAISMGLKSSNRGLCTSLKWRT